MPAQCSPRDGSIFCSNHENCPGTINGVANAFAAYNTRYVMQPASVVPAANGSANLYYSYDHGPVHWISLCSELDLSMGSPQWVWLQTDLAAVANNRNVTPWLIVTIHRPIYSTDTSEYDSHSPGCPFSVALEPSFKTYGVDLVLQGHEHCYERSAAVFNGTVLQTGPQYVNPGAPVYIVAGMSGAFQRETFVTPTPAWSAVAFQNVYGFGRLTINGTYLYMVSESERREQRRGGREMEWAERESAQRARAAS